MLQEELDSLSDSVQLCLHCGLCCMGYFHDRANINNDFDQLLAQEMGATILEDPDSKRYFALPCPKFEGKCSIYPERPSVCENHKCDLLQSLNNGELGLEKAKHISNEMKELCVFLDQALNMLQPEDKIRQFEGRFTILFSSEDIVQIKKKYPHLFLKYALYLRLKEHYFYARNE